MGTTSPDSKTKVCHICGEPAVDIICERCHTKIQAEAAHKKQQTERKVKTDSNRK